MQTCAFLLALTNVLLILAGYHERQMDEHELRGRRIKALH